MPRSALANSPQLHPRTHDKAPTGSCSINLKRSNDRKQRYATFEMATERACNFEDSFSDIDMEELDSYLTSPPVRVPIPRVLIAIRARTSLPSPSPFQKYPVCQFNNPTVRRDAPRFRAPRIPRPGD